MRNRQLSASYKITDLRPMSENISKNLKTTALFDIQRYKYDNQSLALKTMDDYLKCFKIKHV